MLLNLINTLVNLTLKFKIELNYYIRLPKLN